MVMARLTPWKTDDEIDFIDRIGRHSIQPEATRVQLLQRYEASLKARTDWGVLHKDEILAYISRLVRREINNV